MRPTPPPRPDLIVGLDWGQKHDFTAVAVVQRDGAHDPVVKPSYTVVQLDRIRQRSYTTVGQQIAQMMRRWELQRAPLICDETGPGTGPDDILVEHGLTPWRISITAGLHVTKHGHQSYGVPKRDLVHACETTLEQGRLKTVPTLPMAEVLVQEMRQFKYRTLPSGHVTFGAAGDALDWRENEHDDLVLAVALAVWFAEDGPRPPELRAAGPTVRQAFRGLWPAGSEPGYEQSEEFLA